MKTITATKHTPTPWKVWPDNGTVVTTPITEVTLARCLHAEDAAFIVRAVNAHEELIALLKRAYVCLEGKEPISGDIMEAISRDEDK